LVGARLEIGRTYALPRFNVTLFAALQGSTLWERGFTESSTLLAAADGLDSFPIWFRAGRQ
jgi:hypothetical protein